MRMVSVKMAKMIMGMEERVLGAKKGRVSRHVHAASALQVGRRRIGCCLWRWLGGAKVGRAGGKVEEEVESSNTCVCCLLIRNRGGLCKWVMGGSAVRRVDTVSQLYKEMDSNLCSRIRYMIKVSTAYCRVWQGVGGICNLAEQGKTQRTRCPCLQQLL